MKGYSKPCFDVYHPDYGFHSHVVECSEATKDFESCSILAEGGKWKDCQAGKQHKCFQEYYEWRRGRGNRCPHCGLPIKRGK